MADSGSITDRVLETLVSAGLLTSEQVSTLKEDASGKGVSAGVVLAERGFVKPVDLASALEEEMGVPQVDLASYAPEDDALALVPAEIARQYRLLPLFEIEGMLTVVIGDAFDVFVLDAVAEQIGLELEPVLADSASVLGAVAQYYGGTAAPTPPPAPEPQPAPAAPAPAPVPTPEPAVASGPAPTPVVAPAPESADDAVPEPEPALEISPEDLVFDAADLFEAPAEGSAAQPIEAPEPESAPAPVAEPTIAEMVQTEIAEDTPTVDLDVLAVADSGKVAVLVSDILEKAVRRGSNRIHLLPYKDDFYLVFRTKGKLEKVGSAPMSMQSALVEGLKSYARLSSVPTNTPALGRLKTRIADKELVLTVSAVPTVAGQRLVVQLAAVKPKPRAVPELGMNEAEARALQAMVERGRGMLLLCAPVAGGRSTTYYALLDHAAQVGKTVYSLERSVEYEIPAVAQVMINPGSPVGAASYFAAGMRQDTDVMALDEVESVEEVHLAIEAAGLGKLVIVTFAAGDIVSGVRRMLDLGAEPHSLAAALTLAVGQRLVRMNCPDCTIEKTDSIAAKIPGAAKGVRGQAGLGCDNCGGTGFRGATGIFEVLPFTEAVRSRIARAGSAEEIAAAAHKAGMRPLTASGLAKVGDGTVSAEELNRVLRFTE